MRLLVLRSLEKMTRSTLVGPHDLVVIMRAPHPLYIWQVALSDQMCVWASGNLAVALLTLFRVISMDSWSYIMYYQIWGCGQPNWDKKGHDRGFGDCE